MRIHPVFYDNSPTWRIPIDTFCPGCRMPKKESVPANVLKGIFMEHVLLKHANSIKIYTDGSKTGPIVLVAQLRPGRE
jgi:hypothetical protein